MAIITTGNSLELTAQQHRQQTAAMLPSYTAALGVRGGVHSGLNMAKTSGMGFTIAPGRAIVQPASPSTGPYVLTSDATATMAFAPGDSTLNRCDIVALKVDETAGVEVPGSLVILSGPLSTGTPVAPTVPAAHEALFKVVIPAGTSAGNGGWSTANRTDLRRRVVSNGAAIPVNSVSERNALEPFEGMQVMRLDIGGSIDRYVSGKWRGNTEWFNLTYGEGWRKVTGSIEARAKVVADGLLLQIWGELYYQGTATIREGMVIATIPASYALQPENNSWLLSTDDAYRSTQVVIVDSAGRIKLGPSPTGRQFMFQGTVPLTVD